MKDPDALEQEWHGVVRRAWIDPDDVAALRVDDAELPFDVPEDANLLEQVDEYGRAAWIADGGERSHLRVVHVRTGDAAETHQVFIVQFHDGRRKGRIKYVPGATEAIARQHDRVVEIVDREDAWLEHVGTVAEFIDRAPALELDLKSGPTKIPRALHEEVGPHRLSQAYQQASS